VIFGHDPKVAWSHVDHDGRSYLLKPEEEAPKRPAS
jgi:hypothetical protein